MRQDQTIHTEQYVPNKERKLYQHVSGDNSLNHTNKRMRKRQKDFRTKYGNGKIITKKAEWIKNMETELRILKKKPYCGIHIDAPKTAL